MSSNVSALVNRFNTRFRILSTAIFLVVCFQLMAGEEVRLNHLQVIGSHNSYHLELHPSVKSVLSKIDPEQEKSLDYSHRPIREQLELLKVRSLELDIYPDPKGGHYSNPTTVNISRLMGLTPPPLPPQEIMSQPGFKIIHAPDADYYGTVFTLKQGLQEVVEWSESNPYHVPVFILLELKEDYLGPGFTKPVPWTETLMRDLEQEILDVAPIEKLITPKFVQGNSPTLLHQIQSHGWPALSECRGKIMLCLDNPGKVRDLYIESTNGAENGRLLFTSLHENHPDAAWFKVNDPVNEFERIQKLVADGFMVRTRADSDTREARTGSTDRRDKAMASGAHFISTDYPEPRRAWSNYSVSWPGTQVARPNPISAPELSNDIDLEILAHEKLPEISPKEIQLLYSEAVNLHLDRRIDEASAGYARVTELNPPTCPTSEQLKVMQQLVPDFRTVPGEPFELVDLVAIHHPTRPVIAYHLFWEDDIDYPDDNDPIDHEVVWVEYDPESGTPKILSSYFHGNIIQTPADPNHAYSAFAVEWGKHGSLPFCCATAKLPDEYKRMKPNWERLHQNGIRKPDSPFARDWPKRFTGDFEDYLSFRSDNPVRHPVKNAIQFHCGLWSNAILDRFALTYNFRPKPDWPE